MFIELTEVDRDGIKNLINVNLIEFVDAYEIKRFRKKTIPCTKVGFRSGCYGYYYETYEEVVQQIQNIVKKERELLERWSVPNKE